MADTSMQILDLDQSSNGLSPPMLESSNELALFHRRIEFHPVRKPFKGFGNGASDFKLETLNPGTAESRRLGSNMFQSAMEGEKTDGSETFDTGLDPELSFGITFRRIGAGLYNLGNTCFLNSVLQCLTYTEPFVAYLQSGKHPKSCHIVGFCAMCAIQKHVSRALQSTGTCLSPDDLVRNLRCVSRNFRNSRQEDAHEYMVNLLECMHRCCLPAGVSSESPCAYNKSLVHKIFGGCLRSQVKCLQCSYFSNTFDPFLDLSLEIVKADSLHKALANFTVAEHLDGGAKQYQCQRCKEKVRALKQLTVDKPPYVLTIHLKRFRAHDPRQKIDKKVSFGPTLDLKPFVSGPYEGDLKYTLYGVLVHNGWSAHSGHYYCFVRTSSGMWYSLDDNRVVQVSEKTVLEQKAYMLFYVHDRRSIALKKPNNVLLKDNIRPNDNGTRICSIYQQDSKRQVQNGSVQNRSIGTVSSTILRQDELDISLVKTPYSNEASGHRVPESPLEASLSKVLSEGVSQSSNVRQDPSPTANCDAYSLKNGANSTTVCSTNNYNEQESSNKSSSVLVSSPSVEDPQNSVKHIRDQASHKNCPISPLEDSCVPSYKDTSVVESQKVNSIKSPVQQKCEKIQVETTAYDSATGRPLDKNAGDCSQSLVNDDTINLFGSSTVTLGSLKRKASGCNLPNRLKKNIFKCHRTRGFLFMRSLSIRKKKKHERSKNKTLDTKIQSNELLMETNCFSSDLGPSTFENSNKVPLFSTHCRQKWAQYVSVEEANFSDAKEVDAQRDSLTNAEDGESRHIIDKNVTVLATHKQHQYSSGCANHRNAKETGNLEDYNRDKMQNGFVGILTRGLEETVVGQWDDVEWPLQTVESTAVKSITLGYLGDEWDEDYDRGKRKKLRQSKIEFSGTNPFQEIATKKMKLKKAKLDRFSYGNQSFRI